jgi:hypothetical protein
VALNVRPISAAERRGYSSVEDRRRALIVLVATSVLVVAWLGGAWLLRPVARLFGGGRRALIAVWLLLVVATLGLALTLG